MTEIPTTPPPETTPGQVRKEMAKSLGLFLLGFGIAFALGVWLMAGIVGGLTSAKTILVLPVLMVACVVVILAMRRKRSALKNGLFAGAAVVFLLSATCWGIEISSWR
jgi:predicted MFS family arabinose efflux permease